MASLFELLHQSPRGSKRQRAGEIPAKHASPLLALFILLAIVVALAAPRASRADDVPAVTIEAVMDTITPYPAGPVLDGPGTLTDTLINPGYAGGTSTATTYASYAGGTGTITGNGTTSGGANVPEINPMVTLSYSFEVVGPTSDVEVPIIVTGTGSTSVSGKGFANDSMVVGGGVFNSSGNLEACSEAGLAACTNPASFSGTIDADVYSNDTTDYVDMSATAEGYETSTWSFSDDPSVEIDPTFADADEYSLIFSADDAAPGGPPAGAPEPSSLPMLGIGLVALVGIKLKKFGAPAEA
jgi:hypothetical protein